MKKCPYCAEEIQDEAVVCKHCGRDLTPKPATPKVSIWKQGAKASAVISVLYALNILFTAPNTVEKVGDLTVGLVVTFVAWWVICAFIVWVWRSIFKSRA